MSINNNNILRVSKTEVSHTTWNGEGVPKDREVDRYDPPKIVGRSEVVKGSNSNIKSLSTVDPVSQISPPDQ